MIELSDECYSIIDSLARCEFDLAATTTPVTPRTVILPDRFSDIEIEEINKIVGIAGFKSCAVANRDYKPEDHTDRVVLTYTDLYMLRRPDPEGPSTMSEPSQTPSRTPLTVGDLRRLLDDASIGDDTPVTYECIVSTNGAALATRAYVQASDAVPESLGGTDPETENTRAVLILTDDPGPKLASAEPASTLRPWWARYARLSIVEREQVWRTFTAGREFSAAVDVRDPDTWDHDSPLRLLLTMAAAGDLTPLADALYAARTPEARPDPQPTVITRLDQIPSTHYSIVGDRFIVCCDGPDDVWSRIEDRTGTDPDTFLSPMPRQRPVYRFDLNGGDPATSTGWKVYVWSGAGWVGYRPLFVDRPSQVEVLRRRAFAQ